MEVGISLFYFYILKKKHFYFVSVNIGNKCVSFIVSTPTVNVFYESGSGISISISYMFLKLACVNDLCSIDS